jgi:hypothetical protein
LPSLSGCQRDGNGGWGDQDQHSGGIRTSLGVDVGIEDDRDDEGAQGKDQH